MDKPWLMDEAEIDKIEYRMRRRSDRREVTVALCRAQHLKTLEWLEGEMYWTSDGGYHGEMWEDHWQEILAQARKDVGDG